MARQLRIEYEGAFYHITSRGNQREKIFWNTKDRERLKALITASGKPARKPGYYGIIRAKWQVNQWFGEMKR